MSPGRSGFLSPQPRRRSRAGPRKPAPALPGLRERTGRPWGFLRAFVLRDEHDTGLVLTAGSIFLHGRDRGFDHAGVGVGGDAGPDPVHVLGVGGEEVFSVQHGGFAGPLLTETGRIAATALMFRSSRIADAALGATSRPRGSYHLGRHRPETVFRPRSTMKAPSTANIRADATEAVNRQPAAGISFSCRMSSLFTAAR